MSFSPLEAPFQDELKCSLCKKLFTSPVLLPCTHTFCRGCLHALGEGRRGGSITCPVCHHKARLPAGIDGLPRNSTVANIIAGLRRSSSPSMEGKKQDRLKRARQLRTRVEEKQEEITKAHLQILECGAQMKLEAEAKKDEISRFFDKLLEEVKILRSTMVEQVDSVLEQGLLECRMNQQDAEDTLNALHSAGQAVGVLINDTFASPKGSPVSEMDCTRYLDELQECIDVDGKYPRPSMTPASLKLPEQWIIMDVLNRISLTSLTSESRASPFQSPYLSRSPSPTDTRWPQLVHAHSKTARRPQGHNGFEGLPARNNTSSLEVLPTLHRKHSTPRGGSSDLHVAPSHPKKPHKKHSGHRHATDRDEEASDSSRTESSHVRAHEPSHHHDTHGEKTEASYVHAHEVPHHHEKHREKMEASYVHAHEAPHHHEHHMEREASPPPHSTGPATSHHMTSAFSTHPFVGAGADSHHVRALPLHGGTQIMIPQSAFPPGTQAGAHLGLTKTPDGSYAIVIPASFFSSGPGVNAAESIQVYGLPQHPQASEGAVPHADGSPMKNIHIQTTPATSSPQTGPAADHTHSSPSDRSNLVHTVHVFPHGMPVGTSEMHPVTASAGDASTVVYTVVPENLPARPHGRPGERQIDQSGHQVDMPSSHPSPSKSCTALQVTFTPACTCAATDTSLDHHDPAGLATLPPSASHATVPASHATTASRALTPFGDPGIMSTGGRIAVVLPSPVLNEKGIAYFNDSIQVYNMQWQPPFSESGAVPGHQWPVVNAQNGIAFPCCHYPFAAAEEGASGAQGATVFPTHQQSTVDHPDGEAHRHADESSHEHHAAPHHSHSGVGVHEHPGDSHHHHASVGTQEQPDPHHRHAGVGTHDHYATPEHRHFGVNTEEVHDAHGHHHAEEAVHEYPHHHRSSSTSYTVEYSLRRPHPSSGSVMDYRDSHPHYPSVSDYRCSSLSSLGQSASPVYLYSTASGTRHPSMSPRRYSDPNAHHHRASLPVHHSDAHLRELSAHSTHQHGDAHTHDYAPPSPCSYPSMVAHGYLPHATHPHDDVHANEHTPTLVHHRSSSYEQPPHTSHQHGDAHTHDYAPPSPCSYPSMVAHGYLPHATHPHDDVHATEHTPTLVHHRSSSYEQPPHTSHQHGDAHTHDYAPPSPCSYPSMVAHGYLPHATHPHDDVHATEHTPTPIHHRSSSYEQPPHTSHQHGDAHTHDYAPPSPCSYPSMVAHGYLPHATHPHDDVHATEHTPTLVHHRSSSYEQPPHTSHHHGDAHTSEHAPAPSYHHSSIGSLVHAAHPTHPHGTAYAPEHSPALAYRHSIDQLAQPPYHHGDAHAQGHTPASAHHRSSADPYDHPSQMSYHHGNEHAPNHTPAQAHHYSSISSVAHEVHASHQHGDVHGQEHTPASAHHRSSVSSQEHPSHTPYHHGNEHAPEHGHAPAYHHSSIGSQEHVAHPHYPHDNAHAPEHGHAPAYHHSSIGSQEHVAHPHYPHDNAHAPEHGHAPAYHHSIVSSQEHVAHPHYAHDNAHAGEHGHAPAYHDSSIGSQEHVAHPHYAHDNAHAPEHGHAPAYHDSSIGSQEHVAHPHYAHDNAHATEHGHAPAYHPSSVSSQEHVAHPHYAHDNAHAGEHGHAPAYHHSSVSSQEHVAHPHYPHDNAHAPEHGHAPAYHHSSIGSQEHVAHPHYPHDNAHAPEHEHAPAYHHSSIGSQEHVAHPHYAHDNAHAGEHGHAPAYHDSSIGSQEHVAHPHYPHDNVHAAEHGHAPAHHRSSSSSYEHPSTTHHPHPDAHDSGHASTPVHHHSSDGAHEHADAPSHRHSSVDAQSSSAPGSHHGNGHAHEHGSAPDAHHGSGHAHEHGSAQGSHHGSGHAQEHGSAQGSHHGSGHAHEHGSSPGSHHGNVHAAGSATDPPHEAHDPAEHQNHHEDDAPPEDHEPAAEKEEDAEPAPEDENMSSNHTCRPELHVHLHPFNTSVQVPTAAPSNERSGQANKSCRQPACGKHRRCSEVKSPLPHNVFTGSGWFQSQSQPSVTIAETAVSSCTGKRFATVQWTPGVPVTTTSVTSVSVSVTSSLRQCRTESTLPLECLRQSMPWPWQIDGLTYISSREGFIHFSLLDEGIKPSICKHGDPRVATTSGCTVVSISTVTPVRMPCTQVTYSTTLLSSTGQDCSNRSTADAGDSKVEPKAQFEVCCHCKSKHPGQELPLLVGKRQKSPPKVTSLQSSRIISNQPAPPPESSREIYAIEFTQDPTSLTYRIVRQDDGSNGISNGSSAPIEDGTIYTAEKSISKCDKTVATLPETFGVEDSGTTYTIGTVCKRNGQYYIVLADKSLDTAVEIIDGRSGQTPGIQSSFHRKSNSLLPIHDTHNDKATDTANLDHRHGNVHRVRSMEGIMSSGEGLPVKVIKSGVNGTQSVPSMSAAVGQAHLQKHENGAHSLKDHSCSPFTVTSGVMLLKSFEEKMCFTSAGYHTVVTRTPVEGSHSPCDRTMSAYVQGSDFTITTRPRAAHGMLMSHGFHDVFPEGLPPVENTSFMEEGFHGSPKSHASASQHHLEGSSSKHHRPYSGSSQSGNKHPNDEHQPKGKAVHLKGTEHEAGKSTKHHKQSPSAHHGGLHDSTESRTGLMPNDKMTQTESEFFLEETDATGTSTQTEEEFFSRSSSIKETHAHGRHHHKKKKHKAWDIVKSYVTHIPDPTLASVARAQRSGRVSQNEIENSFLPDRKYSDSAAKHTGRESLTYGETLNSPILTKRHNAGSELHAMTEARDETGHVKGHHNDVYRHSLRHSSLHEPTFSVLKHELSGENPLVLETRDIHRSSENEHDRSRSRSPRRSSRSKSRSSSKKAKGKKAGGKKQKRKEGSPGSSRKKGPGEGAKSQTGKRKGAAKGGRSLAKNNNQSFEEGDEDATRRSRRREEIILALSKANESDLDRSTPLDHDEDGFFDKPSEDVFGMNKGQWNETSEIKFLVASTVADTADSIQEEHVDGPPDEPSSNRTTSTEGAVRYDPIITLSNQSDETELTTVAPEMDRNISAGTDFFDVSQAVSNRATGLGLRVADGPQIWKRKNADWTMARDDEKLHQRQPSLQDRDKPTTSKTNARFKRKGPKALSSSKRKDKNHSKRRDASRSSSWASSGSFGEVSSCRSRSPSSDLQSLSRTSLTSGQAILKELGHFLSSTVAPRRPGTGHSSKSNNAHSRSPRHSHVKNKTGAPLKSTSGNKTGAPLKSTSGKHGLDSRPLQVSSEVQTGRPRARHQRKPSGRSVSPSCASRISSRESQKRRRKRGGDSKSRHKHQLASTTSESPSQSDPPSESSDHSDAKERSRSKDRRRGSLSSRKGHRQRPKLLRHRDHSEES